MTVEVRSIKLNKILTNNSIFDTHLVAAYIKLKTQINTIHKDRMNGYVS